VPSLAGELRSESTGFQSPGASITDSFFICAATVMVARLPRLRVAVLLAIVLFVPATGLIRLISNRLYSCSSHLWVFQ